MRGLTIKEMRVSCKEMLTPGDIAPVIGSDRFTISVTARQHPERINYPFTFVGNRMKIPRVGFLRWYDG